MIISTRIGSTESLGRESLCCRQNAAFHLRAACPEGAGRSPSAQRWKGFKCDGFLETRARQVQTLVLPRLSRPRRRPAPPALPPHAIAAVLHTSSSNVHPRRCDRDRFGASGSRSAPFVASGARAPRWSKKSACLVEKLAREARGIDDCASAERLPFNCRRQLAKRVGACWRATLARQ